MVSDLGSILPCEITEPKITFKTVYSGDGKSCSLRSGSRRGKKTTKCSTKLSLGVLRRQSLPSVGTGKCVLNYESSELLM